MGKQNFQTARLDSLLKVKTSWLKPNGQNQLVQQLINHFWRFNYDHPEDFLWGDFPHKNRERFQWMGDIAGNWST